MDRISNPGSSRRPSFFKVLMGDFSQQLRIPPAFVSHFNGVVPYYCMLWDSAKRAWHVDVQKDVAEATMTSDKPSKFQRLIHEDNECARRHVTRRTSGPSVAEVTEEDRALKEARKYMSNSKCPNFKRIMRPSYLQNGYMSFPTRFAKRHVTEGSKSVGLQIEMDRISNPGSSRRPSFFKVLMGDFSQQLRIPPAFVKHFNGVVPLKCMLWNSAKRSWHVDVEMVDKKLFFQKGWGPFVQDNSLEAGDFLLFQCTGNSQFYVEMYGKNCCEKDVTEATMTSDKPTGKFQRLIHEHDESARQRVTRRTSCSSVAEETEEDRALNEARKFMSNSKYPSFKCIMRPSYLQNGYMSVPPSFAKLHITEGTESVKLQISKKSWPVNCIIYTKNCVLTGGWTAFARKHALQLGDVCVFELIHRSDVVLKVSIFRHVN
ncbi:hypothetical protein F0562_003864 [Nyssa sinensis]|uniref:TF-B3 domain-containing protein n=1 Tax=Nyssa sinensis TaxID=561372 RepID=A0A5J5C046_9ASTE|nr:hypothetical protein F0562_003864 [Nyssa sinensis]